MSLVRREGQRVLILAPHADDETLGCGGTIRAFVEAGSAVRVVIASFVTSACRRYRQDCRSYVAYSGEQRFEELERAMAILGVPEYHVLHLEDAPHPRFHGRLDALARVDLVSDIEHQMEDFQPTVVLAPSRTKHQDHVSLHDAAITATRPYFWSGSTLLYETDGELEFRPTLFTALTDEQMEVKLQALSAYQTQVGTGCHPVSERAVRARAVFRGLAVYAPYAEAFEVVRLNG